MERKAPWSAPSAIAQRISDDHLDARAARSALRRPRRAPAGGTQIEIITQPGLGPIRFNLGYRMRGDRLTGRSPFTPVRGPEQFRTLFFGTSGTLTSPFFGQPTSVARKVETGFNFSF